MGDGTRSRLGAAVCTTLVLGNFGVPHSAKIAAECFVSVHSSRLWKVDRVGEEGT